MAVSIKEVLLSQSGKTGYFTAVADDTAAVTLDLFTGEIVLIEAAAGGGGTVVKDLIMSSGLIVFPR